MIMFLGGSEVRLFSNSLGEFPGGHRVLESDGRRVQARPTSRSKFKIKKQPAIHSSSQQHTLAAYHLLYTRAPLDLRAFIAYTQAPSCSEYQTRTTCPALHLATTTLSSTRPRVPHLRMNHQPTSPMFQPHPRALHRARSTEALSMPTTHSLADEERR